MLGVNLIWPCMGKTGVWQQPYPPLTCPSNLTGRTNKGVLPLYAASHCLPALTLPSLPVLSASPAASMRGTLAALLPAAGHHDY